MNCTNHKDPVEVMRTQAAVEQKKAPKAKAGPSQPHCRPGPGRERKSAARLAFRSATECPCLSGVQTCPKR